MFIDIAEWIGRQEVHLTYKAVAIVVLIRRSRGVHFIRRRAPLDPEWGPPSPCHKKETNNIFFTEFTDDTDGISKHKLTPKTPTLRHYDNT